MKTRLGAFFERMSKIYEEDGLFHDTEVQANELIVKVLIANAIIIVLILAAVIGAFEGIKYKEYQIQLHPGDKLFLYSDGVPEATAPDLQLFGTERMLEALNQDPEGAPRAILSNVQHAVDKFVGVAEQFDDLTMLCLSYK